MSNLKYTDFVYPPNDFQIMENNGLTKREYFAAMAMQGLCANSIPGNQHIPNNLASEAVVYADALIAELSKAESRA